MKGDGNQLDFGARVYDSRIGRWLAADNVIKPSLSVYQFGKNSPVNYVDPDGNDEIHFYFNVQTQLDSKGEARTIVMISSRVVVNGDPNHTFYVHYNKGAFDKPIQIKPFKEGTNLPNTTSFKAAENGLPMAPVTKYLYGFAKNYTDDYEFLGRVLQVDNSVLEYYNKNDKQWGWALNGAKANSTTAQFAKDLVGKSELVFAVIDGYYAVKGVASLINEARIGIAYEKFSEDGATFAAYKNQALGYYEFSSEKGLSLDLNIPENLQGKGYGSQIFSHAMEATQANKFSATWIVDDSYVRGMSDNYKAFWDAKKLGKTDAEAAWSTWSGRQAQKHGFTKVTVTNVDAHTIMATFTK